MHAAVISNRERQIIRSAGSGRANIVCLGLGDVSTAAVTEAKLKPLLLERRFRMRVEIPHLAIFNPDHVLSALWRRVSLHAGRQKALTTLPSGGNAGSTVCVAGC
jgi:hypothetical protein